MSLYDQLKRIFNKDDLGACKIFVKQLVDSQVGLVCNPIINDHSLDDRQLNLYTVLDYYLSTGQGEKCAGYIVELILTIVKIYEVQTLFMKRYSGEDFSNNAWAMTPKYRDYCKKWTNETIVSRLKIIKG